MEIRELNDRLVQNLEHVLAYLLPHGIKQHHEYCVGSVQGEAGDSLRVHLTGAKRGVWCDFSNPDHKGDLVDLWRFHYNINTAEACKQIREFLGIPTTYRNRHTFKRPEFPPFDPEPSEVFRYLTVQRRLSASTLNLYGVQWDDHWYILPSYWEDELIHWKKISIHRPHGKKQVAMSKDTEPVLFGWQAIDFNQRYVVITEGELDAMTFCEYGFQALSLPQGGGGGKKQQWLDQEMEHLDSFDTIFLALDNDQEGFDAVKEIVRRLGHHRCKIVELPLKDCNECLKEGVTPETIQACLQNAKSVPGEWLTVEKEPTHLPPHNTTLEQYVLSWLLNNHEEPHLVFSHLQAEDFFWPSHRAIFRAALELHKKGQSLGIANITDELVLAKLYGELVTKGHLDDLRLVIPDGDLVDICKSVRGFATLRLLAQAGENIHRIALTNPDSLLAVTQSQEQILTVTRREMFEDNLITIAQGLDPVMEEIYQRIQNPSEVPGLATGFYKLDKLTGGFKPNDMIVVAARPSMGKTAFAMNVAHSVALQDGKPVVIFSLEMGKEELLYRLISIDSEVDCSKIQRGLINPDELKKVQKSYIRLQACKLFIEDSSHLTPSRMKLVCESAIMKAKSDLGLVIVDYLQLMSPDIERKQDSVNDRVSAISKNIKGNAKQLKVPIVAVAQLNRSVDARPNKRPVLSDLRDSGAIEQDSDVVIFLYRDEYYNRETQKKGIAEINIAKQRNGVVGDFELVWDYNCGKFRNMAEMNREELPPL